MRMKVAFARRPTAPPQAASPGDRRWCPAGPANGGSGVGGRKRKMIPDPEAVLKWVVKGKKPVELWFFHRKTLHT